MKICKQEKMNTRTYDRITYDSSATVSHAPYDDLAPVGSSRSIFCGGSTRTVCSDVSDDRSASCDSFDQRKKMSCF